MLVGCVATASAQEPVVRPLLPGVRARVVGRAETYEGILLNHDALQVVMAPVGGGQPRSIATWSIERVEVVVGQKRPWLMGIVTGAAMWAAILGATGDVDPLNCGDESINFCSRGEAMLAGAAVGAALGAYVASKTPQDHYAPVDISQWRPGARSAALGAKVRVGF
jgi:hypothetical protein